MLKRLSIQNVALIDSAELEFSPGFNVLTGETGAGKSVILDSIDFVLGAKADKGMVRSGADACFVRAEFTAEDPAVKEILGEFDIEAEETLVVSRKLTADGRGSLKLNGCPVTAAMLRRVTSLLVDVHGQSEHFFLLKESNQLKLLDAIGGAPVAEKKQAVRALVAARKEIAAELSRLGGDEGERARRLDILRYQIEELERASLREGEEEELSALRARYQNAEKILDSLKQAREYLSADGGGIDAARGAQRAAIGISAFDERYRALGDRLENAVAELSDIAECLQDFADELDIDEREAARAEARFDEIRSMKKKYGGSVEAALRFLEEARAECDLLTDSGERFRVLTARLEETDRALYSACCNLTQARKQAAASFTGRVVAELKTLNIPSARFEAEFGEYGAEDVPHATNEGLGGVRFLFSANAGEPMKELGKIISGGEMSRFMLAIKAQLSAAGGIGTYIFDEIDAGIGGKTARVVAEKFCKIAKNVQLIAVTHQAQIASFADNEFLIEKREQDGKTHTTIREIGGKERILEIARLIGSGSEHVLAQAEELMSEAETYKNSL